MASAHHVRKNLRCYKRDSGECWGFPRCEPHPEPSECRGGSECSTCSLHRLHFAPSEGRIGSECSSCGLHGLHPEPGEGWAGSKCRVCRLHRLHSIHQVAGLVPYAGCVAYTDCIPSQGNAHLAPYAGRVVYAGCIPSIGQSEWCRMQGLLLALPFESQRALRIPEASLSTGRSPARGVSGRHGRRPNGASQALCSRCGVSRVHHCRAAVHHRYRAASWAQRFTPARALARAFSYHVSPASTAASRPAAAC